MEIPILQDIAIIFGISILVLYICDKIHLPPIIGFLFTGTLIGPHGLHLIKSEHEVEILAEIGVVLLLYTIGLELSFKELLRSKKAVLLGGSLQVLITIFVIFGIANAFGYTTGEAIFFGFLVALSSTAIVLGIFQAKDEVHTPHGKNVLAILIFQDIVMVIMMLLTPLLKGGDSNIALSLALLLLKTVAIIGLVIVSTKYIVPYILYRIAKGKNEEMFLLSIVSICLLVAWGSSSVGLSLGLGAFLAGLIISESEYSLRALGSVLPFRSVFLSFFFVSVGTLFNISFLGQNLFLILGLAVSVLFIKISVLFLVGGILKLPLRVTIILSLSLGQIGEFSFLLSRMGIESGLLNDHNYQLFLSVAILSMGLTPLMVFLAPRLADYVMTWPLPEKLKVGLAPMSLMTPQPNEGQLKEHLLIIGFGLNGRLLAKTAKEASIPYTILEMNASTVREEREKGQPILYGDSTQETVLKHAHIQNAFVVVIAISDIKATRRIVELVRKLNPKCYIIARTRFVLEVDRLMKLGANMVVPVEFEAALSIQKDVLTHYLIPPNEIDRFMDRVREDGYRKYIISTISEHFDQGRIDKMFD